MPETQTSHTQRVARWLDDRFRIPGTGIRLGFDALIGLIPGAGDWIGGVISLYFIAVGAVYQVAPVVMLRMFFNILMDTVIGSIPLAGDLFDIGWKANIRNAKLLEKYQQSSEEVARHSRWLLWALFVIFAVLVFSLIAGFIWLITKFFGLIF